MLLNKILDLENLLKLTTDENELIRIYKELMTLYNSYMPHKTIEIAKKAIEIAKEKSDKKDFVWIEGTMATALLYNCQYFESFELFLKCKQFYNEIGDEKSELICLSNISNIYFELNDYNTALFIWKELSEKFKKLGEFKNNHILLTNIIITYIVSYKNIEGINEEDFIEYMTFYEENQMKNDLNYCYLLLGYANFLGYKNEKNKQLQVINNAIKYAEENKFNRILHGLYFERSVLYKENRDFIRYLDDLQKSEYIIKNYNIKINREEVYNELYIYYSSNRKYKKALKYHEELRKIEIEKSEKKEKIKLFFQKLNFNIDNEVRHKITSKLINKFVFDSNRFILEEDINGSIIKIKIEQILSVKSYNKYSQVKIIEDKNIYLRKSLSQLYEQFENEFKENHLFFWNNARNEFINLSWISKFVPNEKKVQLYVIDKHYEYTITNRQIPLLKKILLNNSSN